MAQGKLHEHNLASAILKEKRSFAVYTPPGYDPGGVPCDLLILFDGPAYKSEIPAPIIVDNLLAEKRIRPLVMVLVNHRDRLKELACSELFAAFVADELVPWVRTNYHVSAQPADTIVGGFSVGGLMAAYCGLRHANVFGNVLSQSGSFWFFPGALSSKGPPTAYEETGWLTDKFVAAPTQPVRFYLEVGRFEASFAASQLSENRRFRDVLKAKGYDVTYAEFNGGHDVLSWRGTFAQGLLALVGTARK
jgi:enterochelin esterase-like enzyme